MTDTPTQDGTAPRGSGLDDAFGRLRTLEVRRDPDRRWFGGVCAGIAGRFDVDPLLIRAAAIALTIAGGLGILVYLVLWLLLPDRDGTILAERAVRHGDAWPVVLVVVTAVFLLGSLGSVVDGGDGLGGPLWLLVPVGLVVWLLATRTRSGRGQWSGTDRPAPYGSAPPSGSAPAGTPPYGSDPYAPAPHGPSVPPPPPGGTAMSAPTSSFAPPAGAGRTGTPTAEYERGLPPAPPVPPRPLGPPPPPRPRRRRPSGYVGLVSLGLAIALGTLGGIVAGPLGFPGEPAVLGFVLALAGVSAVVLGLGLTGRASGFSGFLTVVLSFLTVVAVLVANAPSTTGGGVGDRTWTPSATSLPASYSLGVGEAVLDLDGLGGLTEGDGPAPVVQAAVGAGELVVEVPAGLDVRVESTVGLGEIRHERVGSDGRELVAARSGDDQSYTTTIGDGTPDVVVRAEVGLGVIMIEES